MYNAAPTDPVPPMVAASCGHLLPRYPRLPKQLRAQGYHPARSWLVTSVLFGLVASCSSKGYNYVGTAYVWDVENLDSPRDELLAPAPSMCAIGLRCDPILDEPKVACAMTVLDNQGVLYDSYAGIERRGRSSQLFFKPNYSLELREADGTTNAPTDLMDMGRDEDWILDGSWVDRSFVRNQLVSDLFASWSDDNYAPQSTYCTVQLNGKYEGIYRLVERPKRDASRIAIAADDGTGSSFVVRQGGGGPLNFRLGLEAQWELTYPNQNAATAAQISGIQNWFDALADSLDASDPSGDVFQLLSLQSTVDWVLLQEFSKNIDAYKLSVHLYKDRGGEAKFVPWDFDLAFGQPIVAPGAPEPVGAHESSGWVGERTDFAQSIVGTPGFTEALADRWRELRQGALSDAAVFDRLDNYFSIIEPELNANFERWPLDRVSFNHIYPPYSLPEVDSYEEEVTMLRQWLEERLAWIDTNIDDFAPESNAE